VVKSALTPMPVNVSPTGAENADAENAPAIANTKNCWYIWVCLARPYKFLTILR